MKKRIRILIWLSVVISVIGYLLLFNRQEQRRSRQNNDLVASARESKQESSRLLLQDPGNIDLHYQYIQAHFNIDFTSDKVKQEKDDAIINEYLILSQNSNSHLRDIGHYGSGLCFSRLNQYKLALTHFYQVSDTTLKYVNNSTGYTLVRLGEPHQALPYFYREIRHRGNLSGAYYNLSQTLLELKEFSRLKQLAANQESYQYFTPTIRRFLALYTLDFFTYILYIFIPLLVSLNLSGVIGAAFILFIWFIYLRKIDIFEPEKFSSLFITLALGMCFSFFAFFLYDMFNFYAGFTLKGKWLNDLLFCIFGIGLIEEFVKIIPLFIMMKFSRQVNETVDYIIYASVSALGFAFIENLIYFDSASIAAVHRRAFTAVVLHMGLTSFIAYGIVYAKVKAHGRRMWLYVLTAFLAAVIFHGLYDYWLIGPGAIGKMTIVSLLILYYLVILYARMINNAVNRSEFYHHNRENAYKRLTWYLIIGLSSVLLVEYLLLALQYGLTAASPRFLLAVFESYVIIFLLAKILGRLELDKKKWIPLYGR